MHWKVEKYKKNFILLPLPGRWSKSVLWQVGPKFSIKEDCNQHGGGITDAGEGHFNANYHRPTYCSLKKLRRKPDSNVGSTRPANGRLVSDTDGYKALWLEYFKQLYMIDPKVDGLLLAHVWVAATEPPLHYTTSSPAKAGEVGCVEECRWYL